VATASEQVRRELTPSEVLELVIGPSPVGTRAFTSDADAHLAFEEHRSELEQRFGEHTWAHWRFVGVASDHANLRRH
jgi:hypothetical protein